MAVRDSMKRRDAAVVGEIYVDHIFAGFETWPKPGEEVFTQQYAQEVGGGGAITACALAKLGRSVSLVGVVGPEERPWLERRFANFGVCLDVLHSGTGRTGVTVSVSTTEDRSFFSYIGENTHLTKHLMSQPVIDTLVQSGHVHFAMPLPASTAGQILPLLRSAGCTVSLDVGHHVGWLRDPANWRICAAVDHLLPNKREAELLCGANAGSYLDFTQRNGWRSGVVKLGARGAAMRQEEHTWRVASPSVKVVDTTGAGDAFNAGFIDGLLDEATGEECLRRGCVCGSMSTRVAGALGGLPDKREFQDFYEQSYRS
jgi:sugar/nucleoside kinase (ribokinase family)